MSLLTTGNWYEVSFYNTNNAAWAALGIRPSIPAGLIDFIVDGTTFVIYVIDAGTGSFAFLGGQANYFDDTLLIASSGLTSFVLSDVNAISSLWAKTGGGDVYLFNNDLGTLQQYASTDVASFKAFLP